MMATSPHDADLFDADAEEAAVVRPRLSRGAKVLVGLGLIVLMAVVAWFGWWFASVPVRWQDVGFTVDSPTQASVTFDVYLYTDHTVNCELRALNSSYVEVGVASVLIDPDAGDEQRLTVPITTVEQATTVIVDDCRPLT